MCTLTNISGLWWPACQHIDFEKEKKEKRKTANHSRFVVTKAMEKEEKENAHLARERKKKKRFGQSRKLHLSTIIVSLDAISLLVHSWPRADKCAFNATCTNIRGNARRTRIRQRSHRRNHPIASSYEIGATSMRARECCEIIPIIITFGIYWAVQR